MSESIEYDSNQKCYTAQQKYNTDIASCNEVYAYGYGEYDDQGSQIWLHEHEQGREDYDTQKWHKSFCDAPKKIFELTAKSGYREYHPEL